MPDITLPNALADASTPTAAQVNANIFRPRTTPDNLAVIDGILEWDNTTKFSITREVVRRGTFTRHGMVGATTNIDYFPDWFGGVDNTNIYSTTSARFKAIPGLGINFYVPWKDGASAVQLFWHVSMIIENGLDEDDLGVQFAGIPPAVGDTVLRLYVDDVDTVVQREFMHGRRTMVVPSDQTDLPFNNSMVPDARMWSDRIIIDPNGYDPLGSQLKLWSRGWHNCGLRVNTATNHVRFRVRRFGYRLYR